MIRRGRPEESAAIAALYERSYATLDYLPRLHTLAEYETFMAKHVREDDVWVWDEDGAVLGFMILRGEELFLLYLEPEHTGRGIGSGLLEHAKRERPDGFTLWTFQQNEGARRFYERHGLHAVELTDGSDNEEKMPDVRYEWRPPGPAAPGSSGR